MKRLFALYLAVSVIFAACLTGCGGGTNDDYSVDSITSYRDIPLVTEEEISAIETLKAENPSFSFGHLLETESFRLPDGSFAGFAIKICALFSELFGIDFIPQYCESWELMIRGLDDQTIDFVGCLTPTAEREARYVMSSPIGGRDVSIFSGTHVPEIKTVADLSGLKIAFVSGTVTKELIVASYSSLFEESVDIQGMSEAVELLRTGEIDAFIIDSTVDPQFSEFDFIRSRRLFWPVVTQVSVSTGNRDFAPIISVINKYLAAGGLSTISTLYDEGNEEYKKNKLFNSLTEEEIAYIERLGDAPVYISLEHDNYPFSFYNKKEGEFEGIAPDVLREVSELTGISFENTTTETTSWTEMLERLKTGEVSIVSHLVYSDERAKSYIWGTIPYSVDNYVLISKIDFPQVRSYEIPSLRTGAFRGSIYEDIYNEWFPGSTNLFLFDTASESFEALERGEIDFVLGANFMLLAQTNYREKSGYIINYYFDVSLESVLGFNQNETILRSIVDKALAYIDLEQISNYWNGRVFDYTGEIERQKTSYISASAIFLFFGLVAVSFLFFNNKRLTENLKNRTVTLTDARQSLQTILDTVPLPIGILDEQTNNIVYGNDLFLEIMEIDSPQELYGLKAEDALAPVQPGPEEPVEMDRFLPDEGSQIIREIRLVSSKKKTIDVRMHIRWTDYRGRRSAIAIMVDLTAEKEYQRSLLAAAEHEKEANQAKSLFLANMSHEIRTPMNGIIGLTDLLLSEDISGRQLQYVKDIKTSSEALLGIINDILDISKVSAGKLKIMPVDIDLSTMLNNIASMVGFSARVKGLNFIDDIRVNSPEYVRLDDVRVRQIIINLLSNSVKFTKEGYVKLSAWIEDGSIFFEVRDTGIGIKPENIPHIFEAFEQADTLKNREIKGTGLGLSITKSLLELMGGSIRVESEYGTGTIFTVTIPYELGDESKIEHIDAELTYLSAPTARVMLVDDIQINLTVGSGLLRLCGIAASVAASGQEALGMIQEQDYDLVFMDHMMPEMDGIETTKRIRAMGGKYRKLPIVALTANAMNESKELLLSSGMDDFISKPIDNGAFVSMLRKWLPPEKIEEDGQSVKAVKPEAYTAALDAAARIRRLDIEQALNRVGGLQDVLETSLKQVSQTADGKLRKMDDCLSAYDLRDFALEAHGLKGMLATVGATYHSELAAQLENAAKSGNMQLCTEKFSEFVSELEELSLGLKAIFTKTEKTQLPEGDISFLTLKVGEAIDLLEGFEAAEAVACLRELDDYSFGEEISGMLRDAEGMAEAFKYDESVLILRSVLEKG